MLWCVRLTDLDDQPAVELIKEIAILERKVVLLEQHLLSLYRSAFDERSSSFKPPAQRRLDFSSNSKDERLDSGIFRCQSALCSRSNRSLKSQIEGEPESPSAISVRIIKCVSAMYVKLADSLSSLSSPVSSLSSTFDRSDSSTSIGESTAGTLEVHSLQSGGQTLRGLDHLRLTYSSLVSRLEHVDPQKMSHVESLAFWVNLHNALIMHAHLTHGIPQNNSKRLFLLFKASYNVGGRVVTADAIQTSILRTRLPRPGKTFRLGTDTRAYAIRTLEPLLYFGLASGSHSDPAVRAYTKEGVLRELETAKEEYMCGTAAVRGDRVRVPRLVELYSREMGLSENDVVEMVQMALPECSRMSMKKSMVERRRRTVEWVPHDFSFRYLISKDVGL